MNKIVKLEKENNLPTNSLKAIVSIESNFNADSINSDAKIHSYGIGQITKATAKHHCNLNFNNIMEVNKNLSCSAKVLAYQYRRFKGNLLKSVLAYNEGTPCVCNGEFYYRDLGRNKKSYCKEWKKVNSKWKSKILKCNSTKGTVRITNYYNKFMREYNKYNSSKIARK